MRLAILSGLVGLALLPAACAGARPAALPVAALAPVAERPACERRHPEVASAPVGDGRQGGAVALAQLGGKTVAYVADEDEATLRLIDLDAGNELALTLLEGSPAQVLVLGDGRVAVTLRDRNRVEILEPTGAKDVPLEARCSAAVAMEPTGLAATPDDRRLLVTSAWGKKLTALDTATLTAAFDVDLPREPRAVVIDEAGQRAFVSHVVGAKLSVVDLQDDKHALREVDLRVRKGSEGKLRGGCQGFALAKSITVEEPKAALPGGATGDGLPPQSLHAEVPARAPAPRPRGRLFAPMVTVDPGEVAARSSGYGNAAPGSAAEQPMVSVVDGAAERAMTKQLLGDGEAHGAECLLPRAAAVDPRDGSLFVTCAGSDVLVQMDTRGADPGRLELRRWRVPSGPTGLAIDPAGHRAVVWGQFDHQLAVIDLAPDGKEPVRVFASPTARSALTADLALGRKLFHRTDDPRISSDGRACASCHPDGREDALTWSTPEGPRQTIMLSGRLQGTQPYGWLGANTRLEDHVTQTFSRLGGNGKMSAAELDTLVTYVGKGMRAPQSDGAVVDVRRAALADRGKALFEADAQGCASCHEDRGTDHAAHDVGSHAQADSVARFDTPSLRFVGGTAPYFHDGRYATLSELLAGSDGKMGHTLQLSHDDATALQAYLETL